MGIDGIDTTEAGRPLDTAVAELVLGWAWNTIYCGVDGTTTQKLLPPNGNVHATLPEFSTELPDAWVVVDHFFAQGVPLSIEHDPSSGKPWAALFQVLPNLPEWGLGNTAPLAICRAALHAVEQAASAASR